MSINFSITEINKTFNCEDITHTGSTQMIGNRGFHLTKTMGKYNKMTGLKSWPYHMCVTIETELQYM